MENTQGKKAAKKPMSPLIKGAIICGVAGLILTFAIQEASLHCGEGENSFGVFLFVPWAAIVVPTRIIYLILGKSWRVGEVGNITGTMIGCMLITNSLLCGFVGVIVGWIAKTIKHSPRNESSQTLL